MTREEARAAAEKARQQQQKAQDDEPAALATVRLDTVKAKPVRWLVPDLIPRGNLTMIAGDGGHGKSAATLDLIARLSKGEPAFGLDYKPGGPAESLLISCEDDLADTVVPR